MKGKVKFFNVEKRFGFILGDDGNDYFVHQSALAEGTRLRENDAVVFDAEEGDKGLKAVNVRLDSGEEEEAQDAGADEAPAEESSEEEETQDAGAEESSEEEAQPAEEGAQDAGAEEAPAEEEQQ